MSNPKRIILISILLFEMCCLAAAQEKLSTAAQRSSLTITATASGERVRITAPASVVQLHVEVYAAGGEKVWDEEIRGGNVFDWQLQDGQGEHLAPGAYVCVVTAKSISGKLTQKIGGVRIEANSVSVERAEWQQLSGQQAQAIGPVEDDSSWTIPGKYEQTTTVIAHDGRDGQLIRGRGALSFRLGDFFRGNDQEQMRLTEEGNLGIGIAKPKAKLDVAGTVRAREGFQFADGSNLNVNDKGALTLTNSNGTIAPNVSGTGTQNRLAKWTDNGGTLGDSVAIDTGTSLQLTAAPSGAVDTNLLYLNATNGTMGMLAGSTPSYGAANGPFFAMRGNTYTTIPNQRGLFTIAAGSVASPAGDDGSVKFNTGNDLLRMVIRPSGNVGVGTPTPGALLDVAGNINTSTQYNLGGNRVLSAGGQNIFAGISAGQNDVPGQGIANSFFGYAAGQSNTTGSNNSFFGTQAGQDNTDSSANSFFGTFAGTQSTSVANSFFGYTAGSSTKGGGGGNSFFGFYAGQSNVSGGDNTTIGAEADVGSGNLDHATAIGAQAVVSSSNTIALGRADGSDIVDVPGKLQIDTLATAGSTSLCLNGSNRVGPCSSSLRYKTQVQPFLGGLNIIRGLRPISFTWKDSGARDLGLGAEEVERVEPLLTFRNKQGESEGVKYNQLSAVLINAVKEQQQQLALQQMLLKQQHREIAALRRLICGKRHDISVCR